MMSVCGIIQPDVLSFVDVHIARLMVSQSADANTSRILFLGERESPDAEITDGSCVRHSA